MNNCIKKKLPSVIATMLMFFSTGLTKAAEYSPECNVNADRVEGLHLVATSKSLDDLSVAVFPNQKENISFLGISLLEGACVKEIYSSMMGQVTFNDGEIFSKNREGNWVYFRSDKERMLSANLDLVYDHLMNQASFIMASSVDQTYINGELTTLNIGIWKVVDSYVVAAFIKRSNGYTSPIEILRSAKPLKSVTFFPSPDSSSGSLWLLQNSEKDNSIITLSWDHSALSKILLSQQ